MAGARDEAQGRPPESTDDLPGRAGAGGQGAVSGFLSSDAAISIAIIAVVWGAHFVSKVENIADSRWTVHTAVSIVRDGDTRIDEYEAVIRRHGYYGVTRINGHLYHHFPIGVATLAVPAIFLMDGFAGLVMKVDLGALCASGVPVRLERFIASGIMAGCAALVYLIARRRLKGRGLPLLAAFVFAFCTPAWSLASRALWQHGPSMLLLTAALYLIVLSRDKPWVVQFASLPLTYSYFVRPTNAIPIAALTVWVLIEHRRHFVRYCLLSLPVAIPFFLYNYSVHMAALPRYYTLYQRALTNPDFLGALAAHLVSPARGLLVYSSVFAFSVWGLWLQVRRRPVDRLAVALAVIIAVHAVVISVFTGWWGGHCFGPRYFSDMVPFLMLLMMPALGAIGKLRRGRRAAVTAALCCTALLSFFIHWRGATSHEVSLWNAMPVDVDRHLERIWDWKDPPFLRGGASPFRVRREGRPRCGPGARPARGCCPGCACQGWRRPHSRRHSWPA